MNAELQNIKTTITQSAVLSEEVIEILLNSIKAVDKELTIVEFKLQRTEKVKRTTSVLLEETIEELEDKRKAIEETNTALKKSLEELKAAQAQLIHAEKMASLGELTAGIAHEIQNPLNFVNNFSELNMELIAELKEELKKGNLEEVTEMANDISLNEQKILQHGKRADGIVKGMLQHSRNSSSDKEITDINALVDEYLRLAYYGFKAKDNSLPGRQSGFNAKFEFDIDKNLPKLLVVPQDIGRVLLNLINNAFHAVNEKKAKSTGDDLYKPTVKIKTEVVSSDTGAEVVRITVSDNGSGIPDNIKDKIFQPFFTTKPTGQGTGLGLSLSYDIIKAHGGELQVTTEEGEGSEFMVMLPTAGQI